MVPGCQRKAPDSGREWQFRERAEMQIQKDKKTHAYTHWDRDKGTRERERNRERAEKESQRMTGTIIVPLTHMHLLPLLRQRIHAGSERQKRGYAKKRREARSANQDDRQYSMPVERGQMQSTEMQAGRQEQSKGEGLQSAVSTISCTAEISETSQEKPRAT